ncbi:unnamed protein product [Ixodes hexagonus]
MSGRFARRPKPHASCAGSWDILRWPATVDARRQQPSPTIVDKHLFRFRVEVPGEPTLTDSPEETGPTWWAWSTHLRLRRCCRASILRRIQGPSRRPSEGKAAFFVVMHSWPKSRSRRRSTTAGCEGHAQPAATTVHRVVPSSIAATWLSTWSKFQASFNPC